MYIYALLVVLRMHEMTPHQTPNDFAINECLQYVQHVPWVILHTAHVIIKIYYGQEHFPIGNSKLCTSTIIENIISIN